MVQVNKYEYDGGSIRLSAEINGERRVFTGIDSVSWGYSNEKTKTKGVGRVHTGQTKGFFSVDDGSIEMHQYEYHNLVDFAGGMQELTETEFELVVKYVDDANNYIENVFKRCRITGVANTSTLSASDNIVTTLNWSALTAEQK